METNGIKICFLGASYASSNNDGKTKNDYVTRVEDVDKLKSSILNLKSNCDFITVSMHAGTEYTRTPNQKQIDFAHSAIDFGADLVIGHHPHWIQTIEKYKNKYIFYSLGNFIFDQMWSEETKEGLVLKIQISKHQIPNNSSLPPLNLRGGEGAIPPATADDLQGTRIPAKLDKIELIPVIIENYSTPRPANEEETKRILEKINQKEKLLYESHVPLD
jgi:poly-gamma-glutamate synthesis protein (capsule biosynthesis protein)